MAVSEKSIEQNIPAVLGQNLKNGDSIFGIGIGPQGRGVVGTSEEGDAVVGDSKTGTGVLGTSDKGYGILARSKQQPFPAVFAESIGNGDAIFGKGTGPQGRGIVGTSEGGDAVVGDSKTGTGILGTSDKGYGIHARSKQQPFPAIFAENIGDGDAIFGKGTGIQGRGIVGTSERGDAVVGDSKTGTGVLGSSISGIGVLGRGRHLAGRFEGDVEVTGDIRLMNADFAEDFDVIELTEPGDVMVLTETGILNPSAKEYDKKVVGVISGAGNYKPGIILDKQNNSEARKPIAMMGKVFCKVDADSSPIETGDMLTTSNIPGYAMKALDPFKAFGAVIGKALASLKEGRGLIPILVVLQ